MVIRNDGDLFHITRITLMVVINDPCNGYKADSCNK